MKKNIDRNQIAFDSVKNLVLKTPHHAPAMVLVVRGARQRPALDESQFRLRALPKLGPEAIAKPVEFPRSFEDHLFGFASNDEAATHLRLFSFLSSSSIVTPSVVLP